MKINGTWQNHGVEMSKMGKNTHGVKGVKIQKSFDPIPTAIMDLQHDDKRQKVFENIYGKVIEEYPHRIYNIRKKVEFENPGKNVIQKTKIVAETLWPNCDFTINFIDRLRKFCLQLNTYVKRYKAEVRLKIDQKLLGI